MECNPLLDVLNTGFTIIEIQSLNSLTLGARPFWPQDFNQKYGTKAFVQGHQGHTKHKGIVCVLYLNDYHLNIF